MAGNKVTLTFAGDADQLVKEQKRGSKSVEDFAKSTTTASKEVETASKSTGDLSGRMSKLGNITEGASTAIGDAGGTLQALVDLQQAGAEKASRLAHALNDVEQAQEDFNQALRDSKQAAIDSGQAAVDVEQANLDAATALKDYNTAVKEHGKGSLEARQASIDLKQAGVDLAQANEDGEQATRDAAQATIDAKGAQIDLNDAQREANPPKLQDWADKLNLISPLVTGLVGIIALVTAGQWLWNAAMTANPLGLLVVAVGLVIAGIVLLATKTQFFQTVWEKVWGFLKGVGAWFAGPFANFFVSGFNTVKGWLDKAGGWFSGLGSGIKKVFAKAGSWITAPFRAAFNAVSDAWNGTIGRLSWTVPGWVPFVGGNSISAPKLPHFHTGGVVSGALGSETLAVLRAGETVNASGGGAGGSVIEIRSGGSKLDDLLVEILARAIRIKGGNVQSVLGSSRG